MLLRRRVIHPLLRLAFHLFYNPFAFTYDVVSVIVSRGHWRAWTRAAIPRIVGTRVLEVPCGTGNLLLDLFAAGYAPVGVDLSPDMIRIARRKLHRASAPLRIARGRVQALPFPSRSFDTVVMTFPPEFIYDRRALAELKRVLAPRGRLVWVDAGRLKPRALWSRMLNTALDAVGGSDTAAAPGGLARAAVDLLAPAGFRAEVEWVHDKDSMVAVVVAMAGGTQ